MRVCLEVSWLSMKFSSLCLCIGAICFLGSAFADDSPLAVKGSCIVYNATGVQAFGEDEGSVAAQLEESISSDKELTVKRNSSFSYEVSISENSLFQAQMNIDQPQLVAYDEQAEECDSLKAGLSSHLAVEPNSWIQVNVTPNDPLLSDQWGLGAIDATKAWDVSQGSEEVVVAVLDTGIDYSHPDLKANMYVNPGEIANNGKDDDNNGYIDDVYGADFHNNDGDPMDDHGHGTHCAGVIGAVTNNGKGMAGIAGTGTIKMIGLKFLSSTGGGTLTNAVKAFDYLRELKIKTGANIRLSSNSWGGGGSSQALQQAIERTIQAGILPVAAAGNANNNNDQSATYPAGYEGVISVAATGEDGNVASFSNYGAETVDIAAPGVSIKSTYPNNSYRNLSGTSMATPHIAGMLALLMSVEPNLNNSQATYRLYATAKALNDSGGKGVKWGLANLNRMLRNIGDQAPDQPIDKVCDYTVELDQFKSDYDAIKATSKVFTADEFNFYKLTFNQMDFEFFGKKMTGGQISANGNFHFAEQKNMDYKAVARNNIVSPFNTDLVANVHILEDSEETLIYWDARLYGDTRPIEIFLSLKKDNSIRMDVSYDADTDFYEKLIKNIRIAIAGSKLDEVIEYAQNDTLPEQNQFGLVFKQVCEEQAAPTPPTPPGDDNESGGGNDGPIVTHLKISKSATAKRANVKLTAASTGVANVAMAIDGQQCVSPVSFNLTKLGDSKYSIKLPGGRISYNLKLTAENGTSDTIKVGRSKRSVRKRRSLNSSKRHRLCEKISRSVRSVKGKAKRRRLRKGTR